MATETETKVPSRAARKRARKRARAAKTTTAAPSGGGIGGFADALAKYFAGEGKGPHDPVTLDDVVHAAKFNGAAPDAKAPKRKPADETE